MPEIIRDTSTVAFNFDRCAKLVSSTIASALPNAKYQQSINECEKPHFAGKSAGCDMRSLEQLFVMDTS